MIWREREREREHFWDSSQRYRTHARILYAASPPPTRRAPRRAARRSRVSRAPTRRRSTASRVQPRLPPPSQILFASDPSGKCGKFVNLGESRARSVSFFCESCKSSTLYAVRVSHSLASGQPQPAQPTTTKKTKTKNGARENLPHVTKCMLNIR